MTNTIQPALSVLIVEDLLDVAESTADLLAMHGHAPRIAASGRAALAAVTHEPADVVLVDLRLPDMDGCDVVREVRRRARGCQPVLIALTGYGTAADQLRTADAGVDLHLVKPTDPAALAGLLARIRDALADRRSHLGVPG